MKVKNSAHSHNWIVGVLGLAAGISMVAFFPKLKAIAAIVALVAIFHLVGIMVVLGSLSFIAPLRFDLVMKKLRKRAVDDRSYDFGWSWSALNGPWLVALALSSLAFGFQLQWPNLWPVWFLLALLAMTCFSGGLILRTSKRSDFASLPLVDLLRSKNDLVLDAGCGGGRTTIALAKVIKHGRVVALDRFDAYYINAGGRALLERNLGIAGLSGRVQIQAGDLTQLPFPDAHFDSAVSAHAIDHLKEHKKTGLAEIFRVLKPGGRFLMVVWVPNWATFSLANVFCFLLTSKAGWRRLADAVGFVIRDEGMFNGMWFAVLERPC